MLVNPKHLATGERSQLASLFGLARQQYLEYLRRQIVQHDRIDLLVTKVLGHELQPFHASMLNWQFKHTDNLQLVGRGFGKSTICTEDKAIHYLIKYPRARIVIASKTIAQAQKRLKAITSQFENNSLLIELFGEFYNVNLWNAREIEIAQRRDPKYKDSPGAAPNDPTPTIACVGARGSIAGAHFDIEFSDDLVDETNSSTEGTREDVNDWYNGTFTPMLDPPDPDIPFRFHRHRVGTRYHRLDQYGRWIAEARRAHESGVDPAQRMWINVIPAYDYRDTSADKLRGYGLGVYDGQGTGRSPWPQRWNVKELAKRRRQIGRIAFEAQYLNDISAMSGEIFDYDNFGEIVDTELSKLYSNMSFYIGADLAISERETADDSAFVVVGKHGRGSEAVYYIVDAMGGKLRFNRQTDTIKELHDRWDSVGAGVKAIGIESVQYQRAQFQNLQDRYPELKPKLRKITPRKGDDKISRAHRRTPLVEAGRVKLLTKLVNVDGDPILKAPGWQVREQMVGLPSGDHDDYWDAFDHALSVSEKRVRSEDDRPTFGLL